MKKQKVNLDYIDIQSILDELQIPYTTRGKNVSGGWIGTQCPFPGCDDRSNHCGLCLSSPVVSCFSCGKSGNYLSFLSAHLGSWNKALEIIQRFSPVELKTPYQKEKSNRVFSVKLPDEANKTPSKYQKDYIESRGYSLKELEILYDFYYCGPVGKWKNRIIIPVYANNKLVTFSSIDIAENSKLRYKHLSEEESIYHCKEILYGMDSILNFDIGMVVEGFFDKARIGQNCVCTMGTLITPEQFKLLTRFKKVITVFDGDSAGYKTSIKIANDLSVFTNVERIILPEGKDPDSLDKEEVKELKRMITIGF